jgi:putative methyltransferase (TIGR04325 family)
VVRNISKFLPEPIRIGLRGLLAPVIGFRVAKSWSDAVARSSGYQSSKTIQSLIISDPIAFANTSNPSFIENRLQQIASAFLEGVASGNKNTIRVLDVGGGLGQYFYLLEKLAPSIQFEWVILETTALCELAKSVAPPKKNIKWISSLDDAQEIFDIALLSSVIQYVESPFKLLDDLIQVAKFLIVNRLPLTSSRNEKICIQRPGFRESKGSYPVHILNEEKVIAYFGARGKILCRWFVPQDVAVVRFKKIINQGLTFRPHLWSQDFRVA